MGALRILLAGEGPNELGDLHTCNGARADRAAEVTEGQGVLQALLCKIRTSDWTIATAYCWKDIRKLRVASADRGDFKNAQRLILRASELGLHGIAFLRDRDGDLDRQRQIEEAVAHGRKKHPKLRIAAGIPIERLESWLCALGGTKGSSENNGNGSDGNAMETRGLIVLDAWLRSTIRA
jgi:hypothetical protein